MSLLPKKCLPMPGWRSSLPAASRSTHLRMSTRLVLERYSSADPGQTRSVSAPSTSKYQDRQPPVTTSTATRRIHLHFVSSSPHWPRVLRPLSVCRRAACRRPCRRISGSTPLRSAFAMPRTMWCTWLTRPPDGVSEAHPHLLGEGVVCGLIHLHGRSSHGLDLRQKPAIAHGTIVTTSRAS